ncbi:triple functional domain protein-like, partial [Amphibalanus amphitrite]|uniref:triple functional domain protein-like n=1 Tax=Amphibalanus amphitrite TaxID=1232801 RepID=UPI001C9263EE
MTQQGGGRTGWARTDPVRVGVSLPARAVGGVNNMPSRPVGSSLPAPVRVRQAPAPAPAPAEPEDELDQLRREFRRRIGSDSDDEFEAFVSKTQQRFQQMFADSEMQGMKSLQGLQGMRLGRDDPFREMGAKNGGSPLASSKARLAGAKDLQPAPAPLKDSVSPRRIGGPSLFDKQSSLLDGRSSLLNGSSLLDGKSLLDGRSMLDGSSLLGSRSLLSSRLGRSEDSPGLSDALVTRSGGGPLSMPSRLPSGVQQTFQSSSTSTTVTSSGGWGQPSVTRVTRQQQQEHTHSDGSEVRQQRAHKTEAATVTQRGGRTHVDAQRQELSHDRAVHMRPDGAAHVTEEVAASGGSRRGVYEASDNGPRQVSLSGNDYNVRAQLGVRQALGGGGGDGQMMPLEGVSGPLWRFFDAGPLIQPPGMRLKYKINVQASQSSFTCLDGELPKITGNQIAFEDSYGSESESDDDDDFTPALAGGSRSGQLGWTGRPALGGSPRTAQRQLGWSNKPALPWRPPSRAGSAEPPPRLEITEVPAEPASERPLRRHRPLCRLRPSGSPPGADPGSAPGAAPAAALPWRSAARPPSLAPSEAPSVESESDLEQSEVDFEQVERQRRERLRKIATELLTTERKYVQELHLIDQIFRRRVEEENRRQHLFNNDVTTQMFLNIQSIHQFHRDHLLQELEARLKDWDNNPRIGDIMKRSAPFLKMYTEYVSGYSNAMNLINTYQQKCPQFAAIMDRIHEMDECVNLPLQHHVIVPVQRVPRYELLLKDYLQKLSADSPDRADAEQALELVTQAARHSNDTMKRVDKFKQLLEIQENISGGPDLVSPTRELLKEGKICKISARSGDHQERYLFLFSDLLLLCSARLINKRIISGPAFRLRAKFSVEGLQVLEGDNLETLNTFYISGSNKNVELYT